MCDSYRQLAGATMSGPVRTVRSPRHHPVQPPGVEDAQDGVCTQSCSPTPTDRRLSSFPTAPEGWYPSGPIATDAILPVHQEQPESLRDQTNPRQLRQEICEQMDYLLSSPVLPRAYARMSTAP